MMLRHSPLALTGALVACISASPAALANPALLARDPVVIETLSTKPELVSGGDVLVKVSLASGLSLGSVRVDLNGRDITSAFRPDTQTQTLTGLVSGLRVGENVLEASAGRGRSQKLTVTNHPITGPVLSGPQQQPFICQTESFNVAGGTLGPALDANCSVATRVDYQYKSTAGGGFKQLLNGNFRPADLAQTTTTDGRSVNYIIRIETGTINRAIYQIAILHDPLVDAEPSFMTRSGGWNERLVYNFGGGCNAGYNQGSNTGGNGGDTFLSHGYAVAMSSLNTFGNKCDDVISAETMLMVKEHFIEKFGVPRHTIGTGASGGSMQQHLIGNNYPGLLDGIQPSRSFSDTLTFTLPYMDCGLIDRAFNSSALPWSLEQKTAVSGHSTYEYCTSNIRSWGSRFINPNAQCDSSIPKELVYDPKTNPGGARCTYADDMVNVYGRDPETGFARRPYDNTGVQYGLKAFNAGVITANHFLDLNERVGGYDIDGNPVPSRMIADPVALRIAYRTGRMNEAGTGLASIPIIDFRQYRDDDGDVHDAGRSLVTRARLIAANGHAKNQIIMFTSSTSFGLATADSLRLIEQWLNNIRSDQSGGTQADKVARNKPAELVDACYTNAGKITDAAQCQALYPTSGNPRLAAGEPPTNDILKCELRPVKRADYTQALTDVQFARLRSIFPNGACDYTQPGVGQQEPKYDWLGYPRAGMAVRATRH